MTITDAVLSTAFDGPMLERADAGQQLHVRVDVNVADDTDYTGWLRVVVMGAGDIPIWSMRTAEGVLLGGTPGRFRVRFTVPSTPALNGSFRIAASLHDAVTDNPTSARSFNDLMRMTSTDLPGILAVDFRADVDALPSVPA